jgi:putative glutamine amidotransferase
MLPLIGITCGSQAGQGTRPPGYRQNRSYARAVATAGGVPVLIPLLDDETALRALYVRLDGVLLPGGGDVNPARYGAQPRDEYQISGVDDALDAVELTLGRWALADGKPVFGICRGQQTLNVAAGGTLYQDIGSQVTGAAPHQFPEARTALVHDVRLERLAPDLRATAWAPDGVIEGLEHPTHPFAVTVQFHPEELVPDHAPSARLFAAFVAACQPRTRSE